MCYILKVMKKEDLPKILPVFPLSNFIIFPRTTVPLNIFEPRYIQMIDNCMKSDRIIGMIQPKKTGELKKPDLHKIGCAGKITSFNETNDGRYLIILNGICRFRIIDEVDNDNLYRECKVKYEDFSNDLIEKSNQIKFTDLKLIFKNLNLQWENQVRDYHKVMRPVKTASYQQVREKIKKKTSDEWRIYQTYLEPMQKSLKSYNIEY